MIALADTLTADRIGLALEAPDHHAAIRIVADLLRGAEDVLDWEELAESLRGACPCLAESGGSFAICLPHARTDSVHAMVMSAGRFDAGIAFPGCALPVRYIFCIGVPKAMENDYLRILGLLARVLKAPETEATLRQAETPAAFLSSLSLLEAKL